MEWDASYSHEDGFDIILESFLVAPHPRMEHTPARGLALFLHSFKNISVLLICSFSEWLWNHNDLKITKVTLTQIPPLFRESFTLPLITKAGSCKNHLCLYSIPDSPKRPPETLRQCKWVLELNIQGCCIFIFVLLTLPLAPPVCTSFYLALAIIF